MGPRRARVRARYFAGHAVQGHGRSSPPSLLSLSLSPHLSSMHFPLRTSRFPLPAGWLAGWLASTPSYFPHIGALTLDPPLLNSHLIDNARLWPSSYALLQTSLRVCHPSSSRWHGQLAASITGMRGADGWGCAVSRGAWSVGSWLLGYLWSFCPCYRGSQAGRQAGNAAPSSHTDSDRSG